MSQDKWYEQDDGPSDAVQAGKNVGRSSLQHGCGYLMTLATLILGGLLNAILRFSLLPDPKFSVKNRTAQVVGRVVKDGWKDVGGVGRTYTASVLSSFQGKSQEFPFAFVDSPGALKSLDDLFDPGDYVGVRFRRGQVLDDGTLVVRVYGAKEY